MDASEKKVIENMSEQQIADSLLEMNTRAQALAWHLAYASDRGQMRSELEKVRAQLKELAEIHAGCEVRQKRTEQLLKEGETLWNKTREAGVALQQERDQMARDLDQAKNSMLIVARERNALKVEVFEKNELIEELKDAIMDEHKKEEGTYQLRIKFCSVQTNVRVSGNVPMVLKWDLEKKMRGYSREKFTGFREKLEKMNGCVS
ncbi:hypothetical protein LR48_Vigan10g263300 [Vigna angularis]|uniref:Kinetochore protein SPC25 n=1 Tax=Phaseolus angularis TaxID=3914 RepID=A0A0L9VNU6_PHAAN|nr:hypothetical protein LR48_Vigan10g263300 [Vigna angularis]